MILNINGKDHIVVVYGDDCFECPMCGDAVCPICKVRYWECDCPGPDSEELSEHENTIDYYDAVVLGYIDDCRKTIQSIH